MRKTDFDSVMELKDAEGWNQTGRDWSFLLGHNPGLCLVACLKDRVIGSITVAGYHRQVAWIGMLLVSRNHRGQGVGRHLLEAILERLEGYDSIKLDATPAGLPVYRKLGFVEELGLLRMLGRIISPPERAGTTESIRPVEPVDLPEMIELDSRIFGTNRAELIRYLYRNDPGSAWVQRRKGRMSGMALGRKGTCYRHIGPLHAQSLADAKALFSAAVSRPQEQAFVLDLASGQVEWRTWLTGIGLVEQRPLYRMYLKGNPYGGKVAYQFAIAGPELG